MEASLLACPLKFALSTILPAYLIVCTCTQQLEQEIKDGVWYLATVSKQVLFRSRDRLGAKRAKPLWTEIIELLGEDYKHIRDQLYGKEED